ncbi:MAG: hypothetical protein ACFB00_07585 [Parvularculaceae bacterium]
MTQRLVLAVAATATLVASASAQPPGQSPVDPAPVDPAPGDPSPDVADEIFDAAERLRSIVARVDPAAAFTETGASFTVSGTPVLFVHDVNANRMRLMSPAANVAEVGADELMRLMQANFESALDARYGVASGIVWSTFIHPLSTLSSEEFVSGLGQVVNLVNSYGGSYNSGVFSFGGGDNANEGRQLLDELEDKAEEI